MSTDNKSERPADHFDKSAWVQFAPDDLTTLNPGDEYRIVAYYERGSLDRVQGKSVYERRLSEPAVGSIVRVARGDRYVRVAAQGAWSWVCVDADEHHDELDSWDAIRGQGPIEILWDGR